jgi:molybdenum cofactor sulfurtransferase
LDHAGTTLYSESQIRTALSELSNTIHANPHRLAYFSCRPLCLSQVYAIDHTLASPSAYGASTSQGVERVRAMILDHFGVTSRTHSLIFTSGATAALKLLGETFPWYAFL